MSLQGSPRILRASALVLAAAILVGCSNDSASTDAAATESVPPVTTTETAGATTAPTPVAATSAGQSPDGDAPDAQSADGQGLQPGQAGYTEASAPAVALNEPATTGDATVTITSLDSVEVSGEDLLPGEVGGAALQVNLSVTAGGQDIDLSGALATLTYGEDAIPAAPLSAAEGTELPSSVAAGQSATGSFRFSVPADARDRVAVTVTVAPGQPAVVFQGSAS
ncbi:hypothetical protein CHIBA101_2145 [Actinomyces sp. Chiba101]|uniref:hypothetical protein n=1 Tax=Actinomyces TaxID=1654 RepID=UPI000974EE57|nr:MULTISPECIES: hypothetical protein [Actinomyces]BAW93974.1 hypothetical protein CHIBA101_2145 [Actinomyces sp. Chiba101]GAV93322.1 hypothetical protein ADENT20671_0065 [Actinomyces denticolens]SUU74474.1 Uncharacterised protein [Actinomyces denticolens]